MQLKMTTSKANYGKKLTLLKWAKGGRNNKTKIMDESGRVDVVSYFHFHLIFDIIFYINYKKEEKRLPHDMH